MEDPLHMNEGRCQCGLKHTPATAMVKNPTGVITTGPGRCQPHREQEEAVQQRKQLGFEAVSFQSRQRDAVTTEAAI